MLNRRHIYAWDRLVLQFSPGIKNEWHRHFGAFLLLAPDAPIAIDVENHPLVASQATLISPNALHRLDSRRSRVATLLIGPDHPWFGYITPVLNAKPIVLFDLAALTPGTIDWDHLFNGSDECGSVRGFIEQTLASLSPRRFAPHVLDPQIAAALAALASDGGHTLGPAELGRCVGLSPVTLMRRFKRELGVRIREYVLWRRLMNVISLIDGRRTLTEIAHLAGFYDQAHLTHTSRRMFDLQPSRVSDISSTQIHLCSCKSASADRARPPRRPK
jgi:AraC-like DNA-binding protein